MASVAHQIFTLLGIDPQSPMAESEAKERLKTLNIHGMKCRRCDGSGKYGAVGSTMRCVSAVTDVGPPGLH